MTHKKQQFIAYTFLTLSIGFLLSGFIYYQRAQTAPQMVESKKNPTGGSAISQDPEVTAWRSYSNEQYSVSFDVPDGWKVEDYTASYPMGGTLVAFSPNDLPCRSCTYFRNGYFSLKIYSKTTDPDYYAIFQQKMADAGEKSDIQPITFDKVPGVAFVNGAAVEHEGWVYELTLDKDDGKAKSSESKIFQKVLASVAFTNLFTE